MPDGSGPAGDASASAGDVRTGVGDGLGVGAGVGVNCATGAGVEAGGVTVEVHPARTTASATASRRGLPWRALGRVNAPPTVLRGESALVTISAPAAVMNRDLDMRLLPL
jgi:hypothetical protein